MSKVFNIILGAGFSSSVAKLPLASELSMSIYDSISSQNIFNSKIADNLKKANRRGSYQYGNDRHALFRDTKFMDFYTSIILKDFDDAYKSIDEYHEANAEQKETLKQIFYEDLRSEWNYETVVSELRALKQSFRRFPACVSEEITVDDIQAAYDYFFKSIFNGVSNFTKIDDHQKDRLKIFIKYLIISGYTIQIFDLNHDNLLEKIIQEDPELSKLYCNFFSEELEDEEFQEAIKVKAMKLNFNLNNKIIHFKPHGSFEIIHSFNHGFLKIENLDSADWFKENQKHWIRDTLLFADTYKSLDTLRSDYHAFCYSKLIKSLSKENPLISIGYGRGDDHLNYAIELGYEVDLSCMCDDTKIFAYLTENIEKPIRESMFLATSYNDLYASTLDFSEFLWNFLSSSKRNYSGIINSH